MGRLPLKITHQRAATAVLLSHACAVSLRASMGQAGRSLRPGGHAGPSQGGEADGEAAVPSSLLCSPHEVPLPEH